MSGKESSPPSRPKVDDKAARLETELERALKRSDNGKFIASFALSIIGLGVVGNYVSWYEFTLIFVLSIVFLIAMAFHWQFPEVVRPLQFVMNWAMKVKADRDGSKYDDEDD